MISQFVNQGVFHLKPHTPVAQKVADEVGFRRFQGEVVGVFCNRTSVNPQFFSQRACAG